MFPFEWGWRLGLSPFSPAGITIKDWRYWQSGNWSNWLPRISKCYHIPMWNFTRHFEILLEITHILIACQSPYRFGTALGVCHLSGTRCADPQASRHRAQARCGRHLWWLQPTHGTTDHPILGEDGPRAQPQLQHLLDSLRSQWWKLLSFWGGLGCFCTQEREEDRFRHHGEEGSRGLSWRAPRLIRLDDVRWTSWHWQVLLVLKMAGHWKNTSQNRSKSWFLMVFVDHAGWIHYRLPPGGWQDHEQRLFNVGGSLRPRLERAPWKIPCFSSCPGGGWLNFWDKHRT